MESKTTYEMPMTLKSETVVKRSVYDAEGKEAVIEEPYDFSSSSGRKALFMMMIEDPLDTGRIEAMKAELEAAAWEMMKELPFL